MDLLLISNLMVAGGTLALAYFTYKSIKSSEKQLKFLQKQTEIFTSEQKPYLLVDDKKFKGNKIELLLSNRGSGTAYDIAVETNFYITKSELTSESKRLLKETPQENWDKLSIKRTFDFIPNKPLLLEKNVESIKTDTFGRISRIIMQRLKIPINYEIVYPSSATTFIFDAKTEQSILKPDEETFFEDFEPYFVVTDKKVGLGAHWQRFLFNELRNFLLQNNIKFIGIEFDLVSRDRIGKVHFHQKIDSCIVDLKENKTLEEAINSGRKVHFTPLDWIEIQKKYKYLPSALYKGEQE